MMASEETQGTQEFEDMKVVKFRWLLGLVGNGRCYNPDWYFEKAAKARVVFGIVLGGLITNKPFIVLTLFLCSLALSRLCWRLPDGSLVSL